MLIPRNRWYMCGQFCPSPGILPLYIRNPALFSGTTNNPGSLATGVMRYANRTTNSVFTQRRTTLILPVAQRAVTPLSNPIP